MVYDAGGRNTLVGESVPDPNVADIYSSTDSVTGETVAWRLEAATATYDAQGRMTAMVGPQGWTGDTVAPSQWSQSWGFNDGGQMTAYEVVRGHTRTTVSYDYGTAPAAGKLASATQTNYTNQDGMAAWVVAGQWATSYAYDMLGRLASATTPGAWSQTYAFDGFGNLVSKTGTGEVGSWSATGLNSADNGASMVDSAATFDQERRLIQYAGLAGTETYRYDASNRRVVRTKTGETWAAEVTFWSGRRMGIYRFTWDTNSQQSYLRSTVVEDLVIGGRVVRPTDRLGSNLAGGRRLLPFGEELSPATVNDEDKFATYRRDMTGLDYADQRYYIPGAGRFMTADPYQASAGAGDPGSWNRYAYVQGDPVNLIDPQGLASIKVILESVADFLTNAKQDSAGYYNGESMLTASQRTPTETSGLNPAEVRMACYEDVQLSNDQQTLLSTAGLSWLGLGTVQQAAFLNTTGALNAAGVSISGLSLASVQVDRITFTAQSSDLLRQRVIDSGNFLVDPFISGKEHAGMAGWGARESKDRFALQIGVGPEGAFVDIDLWNPISSVAGAVGHLFEVISNHRSGQTTSQYQVAAGLGSSVTGHNCR